MRVVVQLGQDLRLIVLNGALDDILRAIGPEEVLNAHCFVLHGLIVLKEAAELPETMIREHYGFLQDLGYPTLNECFSRAHRNMGSCCHSWSGGAAIYLARYTMGFRQEEAGNRQDWVLDPVSPSLDSAQCRFLHEDGPIAIEWEKAADGIRAKVSAPSTVRIRPAEGVALAQR